MKEQNSIQSFEKLLGKSISEIKYIETKFHYDILSGDWTNVHTDDFVLHSPEWEITFSDGEKLYVTNPFSNSDGITIPNMLKLESTSKAKPNDKIHKVPFDFGWKNIINKEIIGIRFYKGSIMTKKLFDFSLNKKYKSIQIIQFYFKYNSGSFCISAMDGDIGRSTFYPNGFLSDRVGFVFDKTIAESLTVSGLTINMKVIHKTSVKK